MGLAAIRCKLGLLSDGGSEIGSTIRAIDRYDFSTKLKSTKVNLHLDQNFSPVQKFGQL